VLLAKKYWNEKANASATQQDAPILNKFLQSTQTNNETTKVHAYAQHDTAS